MKIAKDELLYTVEHSDDPVFLNQVHTYLTHPYYTFEPRPDNPQELDEQTSFHDERFDGISCCVAGTGAGKSFSTAHRLATWLRETPPPDPITPYWILSKTMDQVAGNCWQQNLSKYVTEIDDVVWYSKVKGQPKAVLLKPASNGNQWMLEFKSYDQGREALQGTNIAGFWADEQCPFPILVEVIGRTRKWSFPGSQIYSLTPLEPAPELEAIYDSQHEHPTWKFYRMSTREALKAGHVSPQFVQALTENELEELIETRMTGAFASYKGLVYKTFKPSVHVIPPRDFGSGFIHLRGIDFGFSHPTAAVWAAKNDLGEYFVYKEYMVNQTSIEDHVKAINTGWGVNETYKDTWADYEDAQARHEFMLRGLPTIPANKEVTGGIATVQSLFRANKLYICNTCPNLIRQIKSYSWNPKKPGLDEVLKVNDDLVDALRYMLHSAAIQEKAEPKKPQPPPVHKPHDPYKTTPRHDPFKR